MIQLIYEPTGKDLGKPVAISEDRVYICSTKHDHPGEFIPFSQLDQAVVEQESKTWQLLKAATFFVVLAVIGLAGVVLLTLTHQEDGPPFRKLGFVMCLCLPISLALLVAKLVAQPGTYVTFVQKGKRMATLLSSFEWNEVGNDVFDILSQAPCTFENKLESWSED